VVGSRFELDAVTGMDSIGGSNGALEERRKRKKMEQGNVRRRQPGRDKVPRWALTHRYLLAGGARVGGRDKAPGTTRRMRARYPPADLYHFPNNYLFFYDGNNHLFF
jgi:hypothetical protein